MSYIHGFMPFLSFFVPAEGLLQGWHLSDSQNQKTCCFYTAKNLHREDFTHRSLYTERDFHRAAFTQTLLHTDAFKHTEAFTQKSLVWRSLTTWSLYTEQLYTQTLFHREVFTQELKLLHAGAFAHTPYKKKLLDTETFTAFSQESFYTEAFAQRCLYKQKLLHTEALTQRSL